MAIGINQEWAGHPGFLLQTKTYAQGMDYVEYGEAHLKQGSIQIWVKPQTRAMAVFVVNDGNGDESVMISFADLKWKDIAVPTSGLIKVTSVWDRSVTYAEGHLETGKISPHDSRLYLVSVSTMIYV